LQLLELVAYGRSDREIGALLHLSPHTVKHRIERLRDALGARNRIELAAWAGRHGFYHS
jgi:DNA-binding NarL/FixJ family response regulator